MHFSLIFSRFWLGIQDEIYCLLKYEHRQILVLLCLNNENVGDLIRAFSFLFLHLLKVFLFLFIFFFFNITEAISSRLFCSFSSPEPPQ